MSKTVNYLVFASATDVSTNTPREVEIMISAEITLKSARDLQKALVCLVGFNSVWIIRGCDGEIVAPHEKY